MENETKTVGVVEIKRQFTLNEEQLADMLCNWMEVPASYEKGFHPYVDYDDADAEKAKAELKAEGVEDIYDSTIVARILVNGGKALFLDPESDYKWDDESLNEGMHWSWEFAGHKPIGGEWHELTLDKFLKGLAAYLEADVCNGCETPQSILDDGDFTDVDAVLQYALYGELVYG